MTEHARLDSVKLTGTVKNGVVEVDMPDGTPVTIEPDPRYSGALPVDLDDDGNMIWTPELEAELAAAEAEADRGEGVEASEFHAFLRARHGL